MLFTQRVLISCAFLFTIVSESYGQQNGLPIGPDTFVPSYYLDIYSDVAQHGGGALEYAELHYRLHGIDEGRSPNPFFHAAYYLDKYPDLRQAFGPNNYRAAIEHWLQCGINEGRRGSPLFDPQFYLAEHPDLMAAYGPKGYRQAYEHYVLNGIKEGRRGIPEIPTPLFFASCETSDDQFASIVSPKHAKEIIKWIGKYREPITRGGKEVVKKGKEVLDWIGRAMALKDLKEYLFPEKCDKCSPEKCGHNKCADRNCRECKGDRGCHGGCDRGCRGGCGCDRGCCGGGKHK
jgi:hypothetical protein